MITSQYNNEIINSIQKQQQHRQQQQQQQNRHLQQPPQRTIKRLQNPSDHISFDRSPSLSSCTRASNTVSASDTPSVSDALSTSDTPSSTTMPVKPKYRYLVYVGLASWLGIFAVQFNRQYPSGLILKFAKDHNLNKVITCFAVTMDLISMAFFPLIAKRISRIRKCPIRTKVACCTVGIFLMNVLLGLVDQIGRWDPSGITTYTFIAVVRLISGMMTGMLFVTVQGRMIDVHFKGNGLIANIILSAMPFTNSIASIIASYMYVRSGWELTGPSVAGIVTLPLIAFQFLVRNTKLVTNHFPTDKCTYKELDSKKQPEEDEGGEKAREAREDTQSDEVRSGASLHTRVLYYVPEVCMAFGNITISLLIFSIPFRIVSYTDYSLPMANIKLGVINIASFLSTFIFTFFISRKRNVIIVCFVGQSFLYIGGVLIYASTTVYDILTFPGSFTVGCLFVGIGDACLNGCILIKFYLSHRWGWYSPKLAQNVSTSFIVVLTLSFSVGAGMSGLSVSRESESYCLIAAVVVFLFNEALLVICYCNTQATGKLAEEKPVDADSDVMLRISSQECEAGLV